MAISIEDIERCLKARTPLIHQPSADASIRVRAAVAMIARQAGADVEVLFIRRSESENDPWSGDIAFPGGRIDSDAEPARAAAERETLEEVGIDLSGVAYLGQLDDVVGGAGAVVVSGFVYNMTTAVTIRPNYEVASARWVRLGTLGESERQGMRSFRYQDRDVSLPALRLFDDDSPHLWGLTYQFVERFMRIIGRSIPTMPWRESDD